MLLPGGDPDRLAVLGDGVLWTYRDLDARVQEWADRLAARGVTEGDRVAHLSRTTPDTVALTHAIWRLGAVTVPLNTRLTLAELSPQVDALSPKVTLVDPSFSDRRSLEGERPRPAPPRPSLAREPTAAILFTSGTTGRPKAAALGRSSFAAAATASALNIGGAPGDRWLLCLPLFHVGGLTMLHRCAACGAALVVQERFDPSAASRAFDELGVTHASLVATTLRRLLDARAGRRFPPGVRAILIGGGPVPAPLLEQARALGAPVLQTYGLTESCAQVATERPGEADGLTAGPPLPGLLVRIVDARGEEIPAGQVGEIEVSGPTIFQGYVGDESETHQVLWKGWLRTGDLGSLDERGGPAHGPDRLRGRERLPGGGGGGAAGSARCAGGSGDRACRPGVGPGPRRGGGGRRWLHRGGGGTPLPRAPRRVQGPSPVHPDAATSLQRGWKNRPERATRTGK